MNETTQVLEQILDLARSAKDAYNKHNSDELKRILKEIIKIPSYGFDFMKVLSYVAGDDRFYEDWSEEFILGCFEKAETHERFFSLLMDIEMACSTEANSKAREIILNKTELMFSSADLYRFRQRFMNYYFEGSTMFPLYFNVKPEIILSEKELSEPVLVEPIEFIDGHLIIDYDFAANFDEESENERLMYADESNRNSIIAEWEVEEKQNQEFLQLFASEEKLYLSCFTDEKPDIKKLKAAAPNCSKAWFMLLRMQNKEPHEWFVNEDDKVVFNFSDNNI